MTNNRIRMGAIFLAVLTSFAAPIGAMAANKGGGGGGGGFHGGGGGGGFHGGGGGGGGGFHGGGGFVGGGGGVYHGGGVPSVGAGPSISRSYAAPSFRGSPSISRSYAAPSFRGNPSVSRSYAGPSFHGSRSFAGRANRNVFVGHGTTINSGRVTTRNVNRNARTTARLNARSKTTSKTTLNTRTLNANVRSNTMRNANLRTNAVRNALKSRTVANALHNTAALRHPATRAGLTAVAATAGWHNWHKGGHGWWRHRNGVYGWVGPLYWPYAYDDFYDYAMWGDDYYDTFWDYGYGDIYAGLFAPYGYDDLAGYLPLYAGGGARTTGVARASRTSGEETGALAQMCGQDSRDIAGLPIDRIARTIEPNSAQRAALDDLANASAAAAESIKAACPTDVALTAPDRLAHMQQRVEAMIAGVETVQPSLDKFYGLLSDEQKMRLTALGQEQRHGASKSTGALAQTCGAAQGGMEWPTAAVDRAVRPTEAQRASLATLQSDTAKAAEILKASCQADSALTPPARLAAVHKRLDAMLEAVKTVRSGLDPFYATLSDEQKARFEAIGPQRTSEIDQPNEPKARHARYRGRGTERDVERLIRNIMQF